MKPTRNEVKRLTTDVNTKLIIDGLWRDFLWLYEETLLSPPGRLKISDPRYVFSENIFRNENGDLETSWATAVGFDNKLLADFAQVYGFFNRATSFYETIIGCYNKLQPLSQSKDSWVITDILLTVANGTSEESTSNALELYKSSLLKLFNALRVGSYEHGNIGADDGTFQFLIDRFQGYYNEKWNTFAVLTDLHAPVTLAIGHATELTLSGQELNLDLADYWKIPAGTNGDILYYNNGWLKLAKGTNDQILRLVSGLPAWSDENTASGAPGTETLTYAASVAIEWNGNTTKKLIVTGACDLVIGTPANYVVRVQISGNYSITTSGTTVLGISGTYSGSKAYNTIDFVPTADGVWLYIQNSTS